MFHSDVQDVLMFVTSSLSTKPNMICFHLKFLLVSFEGWKVRPFCGRTQAALSLATSLILYKVKLSNSVDSSVQFIWETH